MVRFKANMRFITVKRFIGFHPTMVRFKGAEAYCMRDEARVSIPLWCDLKTKPAGPIDPGFKFPSHYGAI